MIANGLQNASIVVWYEIACSTNESEGSTNNEKREVWVNFTSDFYFRIRENDEQGIWKRPHESHENTLWWVRARGFCKKEQVRQLTLIVCYS